MTHVNYVMLSPILLFAQIVILLFAFLSVGDYIAQWLKITITT